LKKLLILSFLALGYQSASATSLLETFGSGANQFSMEFVTIGNPNNAADTTGNPNPAGSVAYTYNLGKYEVSRDMITKANSAVDLGITLTDMTSYGGNEGLKPATGISWNEAAKFVNYLNISTGNAPAYKFDGSGNIQLWSEWDEGYNANNMFRNSLAKYVIASRDEWYKGAYGSPDGTWNNYATGSDNVPTPVSGGTAADTAVYGLPSFHGPAYFFLAGGLSAYGTMAQGGNVPEWNETAQDGSNDIADENREVRGGRWNSLDGSLSASTRNTNPFPPSSESNTFLGFRVASVPEPSALSLLAIGLGGLALVRRRK